MNLTVNFPLLLCVEFVTLTLSIASLHMCVCPQIIWDRVDKLGSQANSGPPLVFVNKVLLDIAVHIHLSLVCGCFQVKQQSWVVVTHTVWFVKWKIFWPLEKKFANP